MAGRWPRRASTGRGSRGAEAEIFQRGARPLTDPGAQAACRLTSSPEELVPNRGPLTVARTSTCATARSHASAASGAWCPNTWTVAAPLTSKKGLGHLSKFIRAPLYPLNTLPSPRLPSDLSARPAPLTEPPVRTGRLTVKGPHSCVSVALLIALKFEAGTATDYESPGTLPGVTQDTDFRVCSNDRRRLLARSGC